MQDELNKTTFARKEDYPDHERDWYLVDASGETLGRLASRVATILIGKHKPEYTQHVDVGDHVVVINASEVHTTGNKLGQKKYEQFSGFPSGLREIPLEKLIVTFPERVIEKAVQGMVPSSNLGDKMLKKLHVYPDEDHPHQAQTPEPTDVEDLPS
jgi:large subunit ribosomal protein L13